MKFEFPREIFESLYKILPDGVELLQSDGQTDMTKLTVGLSNFRRRLKSIKRNHFNLIGFAIRICNLIFVYPNIPHAPQ